MNIKGSVIAILTLMVVVLAGVTGYLLLKQSHVAADAQPDAAAPVSRVPPSTSASKTVVASSKNKAVALDLSSAFSRQYKPLLTKALKKPANFNEHYVVTEIGCGTACFSYAVIDKNTGKAYGAPIANDLGEHPEASGYGYSLHSNLVKIITDNGSKINTYAFTGAGFSLIASQPAS